MTLYNLFYRCAPPEVTLDIKKTTHKKVSVLMKSLETAELLKVGPLDSDDTQDPDVLYLLDFTKKHDLFKGIKVDDVEVFRAQIEARSTAAVSRLVDTPSGNLSSSNHIEGGAKDSSIFAFNAEKPRAKGDRTIEIIELFKPNKTLREVMGDALPTVLEYGGYTTAAELRTGLINYLREEGLEYSEDRSCIVFDSTHALCACLDMHMVRDAMPGVSVKESTTASVVLEAAGDTTPEVVEDYVDTVGGVWIPSVTPLAVGGWGVDKGTVWKPVELPKATPPLIPPVIKRK